MWLRAPTKNVKSINLGAKWLQNGNENDKTWEEGAVSGKKENH